MITGCQPAPLSIPSTLRSVTQKPHLCAMFSRRFAGNRAIKRRQANCFQQLWIQTHAKDGLAPKHWAWQGSARCVRHLFSLWSDLLCWVLGIVEPVKQAVHVEGMGLGKWNEIEGQVTADNEASCFSDMESDGRSDSPAQASGDRNQGD